MKLLKFVFSIVFVVLIVGCVQQKNDSILIKTSIDNVFILKDSFAVKNKKDSTIYRKVWLYLPPNYDNSKESFPVIYMHDGQNLFDAKTSYAGEWKVDETLNTIYKKKGKGFIAVGIENAGKERLNEYSPWIHQKYGGGNGDRYLNMILNDLKPLIDKNFRTKKDANNTAIIGSSMGGLISYYAGLKHPEVFKKIGALSTSFWFSNEVKNCTKSRGNLQNSKLFLLVGGKEGGGMDSDMKTMEKLLKKTGFNSNNLQSKINSEGKHNEAFWSSEFEEVITWLFNL